MTGEIKALRVARILSRIQCGFGEGCAMFRMNLWSDREGYQHNSGWVEEGKGRKGSYGRKKKVGEGKDVCKKILKLLQTKF